MVFEPNRGQSRAGVQFLSRGRGYALFLTPEESVLVLRRGASQKEAASTATLRMKLSGASKSPTLRGDDPLRSVSNYLIGSDPKKWRRSVPNFQKVRYQGVYRGIDLVYYGSNGSLEYDFELAPGANPNQIALAIEGAESATIDRSGDLVLQFAGGEVRWRKPVSYQLAGGVRVPVESEYRRLPGGKFGFRVGRYDRTKPLVIDPFLFYSTYLGGSSLERSARVTVDSSGNVYVAGSTLSANFPLSGGLDTVCGTGGNCNGGADDFYVQKLDSSGTLVFGTFLGGSGSELMHPVSSGGIAVDSGSNIYLTGSTNSTDYPTTGGAYKTVLAGGRDVVITKIDAGGASLAYSTYLGGTGDEQGAAIAVDGGGDAFVTGSTDSVTGFGATAGAFQTTVRAEGDAFVARLNSTGTGVVYLSALGGNGFDAGYAIKVDGSSVAYVAGVTGSANFFATPGVIRQVTDDGGVFRSANSGAAWTRTVTGLTHFEVSSLLMDPADPSILYAGTRGDGVFVSADGGLSWNSANTGLTNLRVNAMAMDPSDSTVLYAGTVAGVFKSTNSGSTWALSSTGITNLEIRSIAVSPQDSNDLLVATAGVSSNVFLSTNAGSSWTAATSGVTGGEVFVVAWDRFLGTRAFLGGADGVFRSTDSGASWTNINGALSTVSPANRSVTAIAVDDVNPATLYIGLGSGALFKTTNGGTSWAAAHTGIRDVAIRAIAIDPDNSQTVYAGGEAGVFRTTNGGTSWTNVGGNTVSRSIRALVVEPGGAGVVLAATEMADAFLTKVSPSGNGVSISTFFGGRGADQVTSMDLVVNEPIIAGRTRSVDLTTVNSVQQLFGGGAEDGFFARLNATASSPVYSGYFGGTGEDSIAAIQRNAVNGNVWFAGTTNSPNLLLLDPLRSSLTAAGNCGAGLPGTPDCTDAFVVRTNAGVIPLFSTYLGGSENDVASGLALHPPTGAALVTGLTFSGDYPVNANSFAIAGNQDAFLTMISESPFDADLTLVANHTPEPVFQGGSILVTFTVTNNGPNTATNVRLFRTAPTTAGLVPVTTSPSQGFCSGVNNESCNLGLLPPGQTATVTFSFIASAPVGTVQLTYAASSDASDSNPLDNLDTANITTVAPACTINFDDTNATGEWTEAANWDTNTLPGPGDNVCIDNFTVTKNGAGGDNVASLFVTDNAGTFSITGGTLSLAGHSFIGGNGLFMSGGTLSGAGLLEVSGHILWTGGTLDGGGTLAVLGGMTIDPVGSVVLRNRTLEGLSTIEWLSGNIHHGQSAVINSRATLIIDGADSFVFNQGGARGTLNSFALMDKFGATQTDVDMTLKVSGSAATTFVNNGGLMRVLAGGSSNSGAFIGFGSGEVRFASGSFALRGHTTFSGDGAISFAGADFQLLGTGTVMSYTTVVPPVLSAGSIGGSGLLLGNLNHTGGTVNVGGSPSLTMLGNYTMSPGATISVELGGVNAGEFGVFTVNGNAALAGTLTFTLINGYTPANGHVFPLITAASLTGNFASLVDVSGSPVPFFSATSATTFELHFGTGGGGCTVNSAASGTWHTPGTWDTTTVPTASDNVCIGSNHAVIVNTGAQAAASLTVTSTDAFTLVNGSLTLTSASPIGAGGFVHAGGTLDGPAILTVNGAFQWNSGTQQGGGSTIVSGLSTLGSVIILRDRTLTLNGGAVQVGGFLSHGQGAVVNLPAGQTYEMQSDADMNFGQGGARGAFNNQGTITKTSGAGASIFDMTLNHTAGVVSSLDGELTFNGDLTATAPFTVTAPGILHFGGLVQVLNTGATVTGTGSVRFSATSVSVNDTYNVTGGTTNLSGSTVYNAAATVQNVGVLTVAGGTLDFSSGELISPPSVAHNNGTLTGSDVLSTPGAYTWSAGTQEGSGTTTIGGALSVTGVVIHRTRTINLNGGAVMSIGGFYSHGQGAVINLAAGQTFNFQDDTDFNHGQGVPRGTFNNLGTVTKTTGTGASVLDMSLMHTGGTVSSLIGELSLGGNTTASAPFAVASGAILHFNAGNHALNTGATVTGAGTVRFSAPTVSLNDLYDITGGTQQLSGGSTTFNSTATVQNVGPLLLTGGSLDFSSGELISPPSVTHSNGTLLGADTVDVAGAYDWSGGNQEGTGTTTVGGMLNVTGIVIHRTRPIHLNGGAVMTGSGFYSHGQGAGINLAAGQTFDFQGDSDFDHGQGGVRGTFTNQGNITKSSGTGTSTLDMVLQHSNGVVSSSSGELSFGGDITATAPFTVAAGAFLRFNAGNHALNPGAQVTGAGTVRFSANTVSLNDLYDVTGGTQQFPSGTTSFNNAALVLNVGPLTITGGTLDFSSGETISPPSVTHANGSLHGADAVNVAGAYDWGGGSQEGVGTTTVGGVLNITAVVIHRTRTINLNGGGVMSGGAFYSHGQGATINLASGQTFDFQTDNNFDHGQGGARGTFNNQGTLTKSGGTGSSIMDMSLNHTGGIVSAAAGQLFLRGGVTASAPFTVAALGILNFDGATQNLNAGATVSGAGTVRFGTGTTTFNDVYNITGTTQVLNGNGVFPAAANVLSVGALILNGGSVDFSSGELITPSTVSHTGALSPVPIASPWLAPTTGAPARKMARGQRTSVGC